MPRLRSSAISSDGAEPPAVGRRRRAELAPRPYGWLGTFHAMASPCEVHVAGADRTTAERVLESCGGEAWRIEHKWSRYRPDNIVHAINTADGRTVVVDDGNGAVDRLRRPSCSSSATGSSISPPACCAKRLALRRQRPRAAAARPSRRCSSASAGRSVSGKSPELVSRPACRSTSAVSARSTPSTAPRRSCGRCRALFAQLRRRSCWRSGRARRAAVARRHRVADRRRRAGEAHRPRARCARDERRRAALLAQERQALQPHPRSDDRLAGRRRTALRDRRGADVHARRHARDARIAARPRRRGVPRGTASAVLGLR